MKGEVGGVRKVGVLEYFEASLPEERIKGLVVNLKN